MNHLTNDSFSQADAEQTSRFYDALHIRYEDVGVFSEQNPNVTTFGVLRDRIVAAGLDKKITGGGVVLDAGCGAWQKGTRILRSFGPARIDAVDFNERPLAHCRR